MDNDARIGGFVVTALGGFVIFALLWNSIGWLAVPVFIGAMAVLVWRFFPRG